LKFECTLADLAGAGNPIRASSGGIAISSEVDDWTPSFFRLTELKFVLTNKSIDKSDIVDIITPIN
jgi:hypothetical protein